MEILKSVTVIDFIFIILCLRILYTAVTRGLVSESLRFLGSLLAAIFAFQFYSLGAEWVAVILPFVKGKALSVVSFLIIFVSVKVVFSLLAGIIGAFFGREYTSVVERWFSLLIGGVRFAVIGSVCVYVLFLSSLDPSLYAGSPTARICKKVAPAFYLGFMDLYRKVHPTAVINEEVQTYYETQSLVSGDSQEGN